MNVDNCWCCLIYMVAYTTNTDKLAAFVFRLTTALIRFTPNMLEHRPCSRSQPALPPGPVQISGAAISGNLYIPDQNG